MSNYALIRIIALHLAGGDKALAEDYIEWATAPDNAPVDYGRITVDKMLTPEQLNEIDATQQFVDLALNAKLRPTKAFRNALIQRTLYTKTNIDFNYVIDRINELSYEEFLRTPYWMAIASYVKDRDNRKCTKCGTTRHLVVHHKTYAHHGDELHHMDDLTTLCRNCHNTIHHK